MSAAPGPLRLGLLLDQPKVPWWLAPALRSARERGIAEIVLVVLRGERGEAGARLSRPLRWWRNRRVLGYALLGRLTRLRRRQPNPPDEPLENLAGEAARLEVRPDTTTFSDRLSETDVESIRKHRLDLLLRAGFRILRGGVLTAARHGVWSFHHGDNRRYRGGPAGAWEVLEDHPESGVTLQVLTEDLDGGKVLARSVCATQRFSLRRNLRSLYECSAPLLLASLERLQRGQDPAHTSSRDSGWDAYARPLYRIPTNRVLAARLPRLAWRYARQRLRSAGKRLQWSLAWHYAETPDADAPHGVFHRYREIPSPRDRFWADPFVIRDRTSWQLFFEEFRFADSRGEIAVWEFNRSGPVGEPRVVLRRPYHLSYPNVFHYEGRWYLMPETASQGRVELYVAERFPDEWRLHTTLLTELPAVDPTLLQHEGTWYLFVTVRDLLQAFSANSPFGPFVPHPANPLVSDIRWARMAGRFFRAAGKLYRPAQRGSPTYGAGIAVAEVLELTPTSYQERLVHQLAPEWDPKLLGMHTINASQGLSVIDLLRYSRR